MNNKITLGIVIVAILVIIGYFVYSSQPIVTAQGTSSLKVEPDEVSVYVNIESRNATLQEAQKENSEITSNVVSGLIAAGVEEKDIQITGYSSYPWIEWQNNNNVNKGFIVSQQIIVKSKTFAGTPKIVDAIVNANALVQTIQFELSEDKQSQYKTEALKKASENAKEKAASIASGQGRELGRLVSVKSDEFNYYPRPYYTFSEGATAKDSIADAKLAAANISPNDLEVSASITVEYKLSFF